MSLTALVFFGFLVAGLVTLALWAEYQDRNRRG
jgi:hypothetical protein